MYSTVQADVGLYAMLLLFKYMCDIYGPILTDMLLEKYYISHMGATKTMFNAPVISCLSQFTFYSHVKMLDTD